MKSPGFKIRKSLREIVALLWVAGGVLLLCACTKKPAESTDWILAKVGDRIITVDEFIRRAEYTVRPPYCHSDSYIHKKIILNSLIAEKLFAVEADTDNELYRNQEFQRYIQGRREQAMRQLHFYRVGYQKVRIKEKKLRQFYRFAGRKYRVMAMVSDDLKTARATLKRLRQDKDSDARPNPISQNKSPRAQEIGFFDELDPTIHAYLFSKPLQKQQIVGPFRTLDNRYTILKIEGWTDQVVITDKDVRKRWDDVKKRLTEYRSQNLYRAYVQRLMKGKKAEFSENTLNQLADLLRPLYIKSPAEKKNDSNARLWGKDLGEPKIDAISAKLELLKDQPFFTLDGKTWTVAEFDMALQSHPLVFRMQEISPEDFPRQLQLAVADLVRDHFITADAYQKGLDKVPDIQGYEKMWSDNLMALYSAHDYLKSFGIKEEGYGTNTIRTIERYLNPLVDSLQAKYSTQIEINTKEFEKIQLTRIDVLALQNNVPYPVVVPFFPLMTTDSQLDYGHRLVQSK